MEPAAGQAVILLENSQEAIMAHWHDTMVDRPDENDPHYMTGWTISGLATLATIVAVWAFAI